MNTRIFLIISLIIICLTLQALTISMPRVVCSIDTGDIDLNGQVDLVVGHFPTPAYPGAAFTVLYNFENGAFTEVDTSIAYYGYQGAIALGKLNNDAYPDLITYYRNMDTGTAVPHMRFVTNVGGHLNNYFDIQFPGNNVFSGYTVGNLTFDELSDLAFYDGYDTLYLWESNPVTHFNPIIKMHLPYPPQQMRCGDIDNDGRDELLIVGQPLTYFDYTDSGWEQIVIDSLHFHSYGFIADVDNDGENEIITQEMPPLGDIYPARIYKKINDNYVMMYESYNNFMGWLLVFDYNDDNLADMLIGNYLETNLGNYTFSESSLLYPGLYAFANTSADVDGNGYNDIIFIGNYYTGLITIYFSDGEGHFLSDPPVANSDNTLPTPDIAYMKAYPNPFVDAVNFSITNIPKLNNCKIQIYNIKGELVKELKDQAISNQFIWDGKDRFNQPVSNGIYFCRLRSDTHVYDTKKVIKTK